MGSEDTLLLHPQPQAQRGPREAGPCLASPLLPPPGERGQAVSISGGPGSGGRGCDCGLDCGPRTYPPAPTPLIRLCRLCKDYHPESPLAPVSRQPN